MAFNPLIDDAPTEWRGVSVNTDFRQALRFFRAMGNKDMPDQTKAMLVIRLFFDEVPALSSDIWEFISYFVSGGKDKDDDEGEGEGGKKLFDFEVDSGRVLAAFQQAYGIDLTTEKIHWWVFLELFRALPDNTMLSKVIDIRGKEIPKDVDKKYIRDLRKAKRAFALEEPSFDSLKDFFRGAQ